MTTKPKTTPATATEPPPEIRRPAPAPEPVDPATQPCAPAHPESGFASGFCITHRAHMGEHPAVE